jgi:ligand-binding sensor domain-containing protein
MFQVKNWRWLSISACVVAALALAGGLVAWRASRAVKLSQQEWRAEREIKLVMRPYAPPVNVNFETVRSPEVFSQLVRFQDHLYIAGPAGLSEYDRSGTLLRDFQAGGELPGSPLVAIAVAQLADSTPPELILATADQGILAFNGRQFRQIYPADAEVRAITAILPVSAGGLLIGTKKRGVLVYDGHSIQELHPTLSHLYIQALAGSETDLWVGTLDQGVKH